MARRRVASRRFIALATGVVLVLIGTSCSKPGHAVVAGTAAPPPSATSTTLSATAATSPAIPSSMVVLGHSGATGFGSDPTDFGRDAKENSWATGTNPQVKSVYLRFLAENPKLAGHNYNFAKDGSRVDDLARQAALAMQLQPPPDLVLIQTIDNDIRCDGSDPQNYAPFEATLIDALEMIHSGAPNAQIFLVSQWGSVEGSVDVGQHLPFSVKYASGAGPCDVYEPTGEIRPQQVLYLQDVVDQYHARLRSACAKVANCRTDNGAMQTLDLVLDDVVADGNHLSVQGHHKMAGIVWDALH